MLKTSVLLILILTSHIVCGQIKDSMRNESRILVVDSISISGNKVTKERVLYNELTKQIGDTLTENELSTHLTLIKQNLLNTSLFNFVWITSKIRDNRIKLDILVQERWYWWVLPILEHADRNASSFFDNGDWSRVRYGIFLNNINFLGRRKSLKVRIKLGYQNVLNVAYQSTQYKTNFGWGVGADYINQDQLQVMTEDNKPVYYTNTDGYALQKIVGRTNINYRHHLYHRHQLTLSYNKIYVADSVLIYNPNYLYNGQNSNEYIELTYTYFKDRRDSKIYPLKGHFWGFDLTTLGSNLWEKDMNYLLTALHGEYYQQLGRRFNIGTDWDGYWSSSKELPYFINYGLGYSDFINGYEYYVIEGTTYFTSQNRLMFNLLPTTITTIKWIPWSQFNKIHYAFYLKTFLDFGYIYNERPMPTNDFTNTMIGAVGVGIDLVTYYDKVLGVSYSINRSGVSGLYVHVNLKM